MAEVYTPPLANPSSGGLYTAATVVDAGDPSRLSVGIQVDTWNCGPSWVWPIAIGIDCDAEEPDPSPKGAEPRTDWINTVFGGDVVGADDNCSALVPGDIAYGRAQQLLRLQEPVRVEKLLVPRLLDAATDEGSATGLVAALGKLEESVAEYGFNGVIHVAPHLVAALAQAQVITRSGAYLLSPNGHRYAFGSGYTELGDSLIATGPVAVHQGLLVPVQGANYPTNQRLTAVEREVLVSWECWTTKVTIGD